MPYRPPSVTLALMRPESHQLAQHWLAERDWGRVRQQALEARWFSQRSLSGQKRAFAEVRFRLQHLDSLEVEALAQASSLLEQRLWIHVAACRAYPLLSSFSRNVLREKLRVHDWEVQRSDFLRHWEAEALLHPELERLSPVSQKGIGRAVLRFLAEVGLLKGTPAHTLNPLRPPPSMIRKVVHQPGAWLEALLLEEAAIQDLLGET